MKIFIKPNAKKPRKILFPTGLLLKILMKDITKQNKDGEKKKIARKTTREILKSLKKYKKENGSFTLLEVEEDGEEIVKIIL